MTQMEQRLRETELQVHGALLGRGASYGDMCMLRLQVSEDVYPAYSFLLCMPSRTVES